jgi:pectate disaccharide-lyase
MKKGQLVILTILAIALLMVWFNCNPVQQQASDSTTFNVLDGVDSVRTTGATTLYVAPNGIAGAAGTIDAPTTLGDALASLGAGGTIYLRGGTYSFSAPVIIAEGDNGKSLLAYNGEIPVLDFSGEAYTSSNRGVIMAASNWTIKGITITKAGDNGMLLAGSNNTIDSCKFLSNQDSGLQLSRYNTAYTTIAQWPGNNKITNCLSDDNLDPDNMGDADGYSPKLTCGGGNVFTNCVSSYNVDDGWDYFTKSDTGAIGSNTMIGCTCLNNGANRAGQKNGNSNGNGFKLGGCTISVSHTLTNCVSINNTGYGYTGNSNPAHMNMTNCTGSGNAKGLMDRIN